MGTELPTKVNLGQTLVLMQVTFLNNVRKVGRLVLSGTSCLYASMSLLTENKSRQQSPSISHELFPYITLKLFNN
jgi:hypothetical protein